jgi:hypothetical protein
MTVAAPSTLMDQLVTRIGQIWDSNSVGYGPPENVPPQAYAWVRYGERTFEYGMFSVEHPTVLITVATPSGQNYAREYAEVNDIANTIAMGLLQDPDSTDPVKFGELTLDGISVSEPVRADYAGQPGAIMACQITLDTHSKEMNL